MSVQVFQDIEDVKALYDYLKSPMNELSNNAAFSKFQRRDFNDQVKKVVEEVQKLFSMCESRLDNYADQDE